MRTGSIPVTRTTLGTAMDYSMEKDMANSDWFVAKVRASDSYAQNLYAAICNRDFVKNDVWPLLNDQRWSASWRAAGGIVADLRDIREDYMDYYCSGIGGVLGGGSEPDPDSDKIFLAQQKFVSEGTVTDEIREDLFRLGWIVLDDE